MATKKIAQGLHLPAAERRAVPWKNGGGVTREIIRDGLSQDPNGFFWRVSIADVSAEGPFSTFPGCQRLIAVIRGAGMRLEVQGREPQWLRPFEVHAFDGASHAAGGLPQGPVADLNVIFDARRVRASMRIIATDESLTSVAQETVLIVNLGEAPMICNEATNVQELAVFDAMRVRQGGTVALSQVAHCAVIRLAMD